MTSNSFSAVLFGYLQYFAGILDIELESSACYIWVFSLLPTYFVYLGAQHPFGKKRNNGLIALGVLTTLISAIFACVVLSGENRFAPEENGGLYVALIILSAIALVAGYLWVSDKHSPAWSALFACGYILFVPLILLAVLVLAAIKLMELFFKDAPSQSNGKTYTAKDENGEEYELTHFRDDLYKDDNGDYWRISEDGETFRRE